TVQDNGEPGTNDTFFITVYGLTGFSQGGPVLRGNIQVTTAISSATTSVTAAIYGTIANGPAYHGVTLKSFDCGIGVTLPSSGTGPGSGTVECELSGTPSRTM